MAMSNPLIVPALTRHTATVIWAHGLGDSGAGWCPIVENWRLRRAFPECKFIFPNAPNIPITVVGSKLSWGFSLLISSQNFGLKMPGWYDIVCPRKLHVCRFLLLLRPTEQ